MSTESKKPISLQTLRDLKKAGKKFAALTSYESTMTSMMCDAGVELILVGDSLGMVIQGHDSTVPVSMEDILYHWWFDDKKAENTGFLDIDSFNGA